MTVPATIAQPCDPLPSFDGSTSDDLVSYNLHVIGMYKECSARHAGVSQ